MYVMLKCRIQAVHDHDNSMEAMALVEVDAVARTEFIVFTAPEVNALGIEEAAGSIKKGRWFDILGDVELLPLKEGEKFPKLGIKGLGTKAVVHTSGVKATSLIGKVPADAVPEC